MKQSLLIIAATLILLSSCDNISLFKDTNASDKDEMSNDSSFVYSNDIIKINEFSFDSIEVVNNSQLIVYSNNDIENQISIGDIILYEDKLNGFNNFVGRIISIIRQGNSVTINTELPSVDEVFSRLSITPTINKNNSFVIYDSDEEDNVLFNGLVDNSIWNELEILYQSEETTTRTRAVADEQRVPIDLTLSFTVKPNQAFSGDLFLRLQGSIIINKDGSYEMSVTQIVGLKGSFSLASYSQDRIYIPLLEFKRGITIYTNKLIAIRWKPSLNFFYSGEIKLEAGFKYEVVNADTYVSYENGEFYNKTFDNKKDTYFRVKSLHSEAEIGLSFNADIYAFLFTEDFLKAGITIVAGVGIGGEKNVGIQFPDIANFDCSAYFSPFLEVTPFIAIRMPNLKKIDGPTFKIASERFAVDLLLNIHNINYQRRQKKLTISSCTKDGKLPLIETTDDGIALFEKGKDEPIAYGSINTIKTKSINNNISFDINGGTRYEIAKYSMTQFDGVLYGERIEIINPIEIVSIAQEWEDIFADEFLRFVGFKYKVNIEYQPEWADLREKGMPFGISVTGLNNREHNAYYVVIDSLNNNVFWVSFVVDKTKFKADPSNNNKMIYCGDTIFFQTYYYDTSGEIIYGLEHPVWPTYYPNICPDENHPHIIDLGLSVKWACCNLGASTPFEDGDRYAWGETTSKSVSTLANYKHYRITTLPDGKTIEGYTKYCDDSSLGYQGYTDSKTQLDLSDDAAHVQWGGQWRMPTIEEFEELFDHLSERFPEGNFYFVASNPETKGTLCLPYNYKCYWTRTFFGPPFHYVFDHNICAVNFNYNYDYFWPRTDLLPIRPVHP